jgi:hypothetical protein
MSILDDPRWDDAREGPSRGRGGAQTGISWWTLGPRDAFTQGLIFHADSTENLCGLTMALRSPRLRMRALAVVGSFRVVPIDDLGDRGDRAADLAAQDLNTVQKDCPSGASVDRDGTAS